VIFAARHDKDFVSTVQRQLDDNVSGAAESDQQQPAFLGQSRSLKRSVADQSAAQQWRDLLVAATLRQCV
jgi:hypothetical protein